MDGAGNLTVAEFTVLLAEDHAEQESTHGLADLLDRLASHLGATPASDPLAQAPGAGTTARRAARGSCVAAAASVSRPCKPMI